MRLPANDRFDLLEFIGATPMEDLDLDELIEQAHQGDDCALVGTVDLTVPEVVGELTIGVALDGRTLDGDPVAATRRTGARIS